MTADLIPCFECGKPIRHAFVGSIPSWTHVVPAAANHYARPQAPTPRAAEVISSPSAAPAAGTLVPGPGPERTGRR